MSNFEHTPSQYQLDIFTDIKSGTGHTCIDARAGSAKTTTLVEGANYLTTRDSFFCAFGTDIAEHLSKLVPPFVEVRTSHSYGRKTLFDYFGNKKIRIEKNKLGGILSDMFEGHANATYKLRRNLAKAVSLSKSALATDEEIIGHLINQFLIDTTGAYGWDDDVANEYDRDAFIDLVQQGLTRCKQDTKTIDFDDMIWMPIALDINGDKYGRVFIDEIQDYTPAQLELAFRTVRRTGRVYGVGDKFQSVYQFRGASDDSLDRFRSRFDAKTLPLPICYRCPKSVVKLAQTIVPDIEWRPNAPDGTVAHFDKEELVEKVQYGDVILSRYNADLLRTALKLIQKKMRVCVMGRDIGRMISGLIEKLDARSIPELIQLSREWRNRESDRLKAVKATKGQIQRIVDLAECVEIFCSMASSVTGVLEVIPTLFVNSDDEDSGERMKSSVVLSTTHKCVALDTWVETSRGLMRISQIADRGVIATADGPAKYFDSVRYEDRDMLRLTTKSGYRLDVTTDHEMMAWDGDFQYRKIRADALQEGTFLRLRLGATCDPEDVALPPDNIELDIRAKRYAIPSRVTPDVAEFFGLMVADGTIFHGGFRIKKRHQDVTERFAALTRQLFDHDTKVVDSRHKTATFDAEVCSTHIRAWLETVDGMNPNEKFVPECILQSSLKSQSAFLRGLFEDGTVNIKDSGGVPRLDHIGLTTCYEELAHLVQLMLLRQGIISSKFEYTIKTKPDWPQWRVSIYGYNAHLFRDQIGFVSAFKNAQLQHRTGNEEYHVPIHPTDLPDLTATATPSARYAHKIANRGYIIRTAARDLGMHEHLKFHHERVVKIESYRGPAMCVTVPRTGRFLQNGFDGCNSKGLQWDKVFMLAYTYPTRREHWDRFADVNEEWITERLREANLVQEERNITYVAITRAAKELYLVRDEKR